MKIILLHDVKNLGYTDDIKKVANGYARNFLFPKNLAVLATKKELKKVQKRQEAKVQTEAKSITQAREKAKILEKQIISLRVKAQKGGKLFGSITEKDIKKAFREQANEEIDEKNILIKEPIKKVGQYDIKVKLFKNILTNVKVRIIG